MNEIQNEKNVMEERKTILEETKRRKLQTQGTYLVLKRTWNPNDFPFPISWI
jgi:hypothetical protein